jgi:GNAT superfamily N-acetyltransferase
MTMDYRIVSLSFEDANKVRACFRLFLALRPHLVEQEFVDQLRRQAGEGYRVAFIEIDGSPVAAAGYRFAHFLAWGKVLYIDDLITDPLRKHKGLAGSLLDWLVAEATKGKCDAVHLDTGYARNDAHRLYLNKGFILNCHHMAKDIR